MTIDINGVNIISDDKKEFDEIRHSYECLVPV